jgi:hypothetical protein
LESLLEIILQEQREQAERITRLQVRLSASFARGTPSAAHR